MALTTEDIQAIAQEVAKQTNNNERADKVNAQAQFLRGSKEQPKQQEHKPQNREKIASIVVSVIWIVGFVVVLARLAPYLH